MSNFYISEILHLTQFAEIDREKEQSLAAIQELVLKHLQHKKQGFSWQKNQILWYNSELANFKIELARAIIRETQHASWDQTLTRVLVLLNLESATVAAQNALLKLIEEPPLNTLILIPVINQQLLLNTINSRCLHYDSIKLETEKKIASQTIHWPNDATAIFTLVNNHKDREAAKKLILNLLKQKLNNQQKEALSQAYLDLQANLNVRLTLEHCFFCDQ